MGGEHGHCSHTDEKREDQAIQGTLYPCKGGKKGLGLQREETVLPLDPRTEEEAITASLAILSISLRSAHRQNLFGVQGVKRGPREEQTLGRAMTLLLKLLLYVSPLIQHTGRGQRA